jgi:hypothetical protein
MMAISIGPNFFSFEHILALCSLVAHLCGVFLRFIILTESTAIVVLFLIDDSGRGGSL